MGKQNLVLFTAKPLQGKNCDFVLSCYNCRVIVKRLPSYLARANVTFVVDDLSSDTEYVFACYASSVVGDGEKSNQIKVRTSEWFHKYVHTIWLILFTTINIYKHIVLLVFIFIVW